MQTLLTNRFSQNTPTRFYQSIFSVASWLACITCDVSTVACDNPWIRKNKDALLLGRGG